MSEDLRQLMVPFQLGNNAKKVFYHTFDELYRQHASDGSIDHNYSIWAVNPLTYEGEVYGIVTSRDAPTVAGKQIDPSTFRDTTSDDLAVQTPIRIVLYMKFGEITTYNKFFTRFRQPGAKSSKQLIHDFDSHILDAHMFSKGGKLVTGQRTKLLKLTDSQWRSRVCVLNTEPG